MHMTTIVNTPPSDSGGSGGNGMGMVVAALLIVAVAALFFVYGLPYLRQAAAPAAPQINIPDKVDVNIQPPANQGQ